MAGVASRFSDEASLFVVGKELQPRSFLVVVRGERS